MALIGVGGGGMNTLDEIRKRNAPVARLIAVNRDRTAIGQSKASYKIFLNAPTHSSGALQQAVLQKEAHIRGLLTGMDAVVLVAGMGGMTGTYASPEIARIAKQCGLAVWAVATSPFHFEGSRRAREARKGMELLAGHADAVIRVNNQDLIKASAEDKSMYAAFRRVDAAVAEIVMVIAKKGRLTGRLLRKLPDGFSLWTGASGPSAATAIPASRSSPVGDAESSATRRGPDEACCSFCGKSRSAVKRLIAGPMVFICNECVKLCVEILEEESC